MGLSPDSFPSAGVCGIGRVVILKMDRYRKELENWGFLCYDSVINKFFGAGRNSPPAVTVRDLRKAADLVRFQNRQYSLDERRNCMTGIVDTGPGLF